jgi:hypothetical protein
VTLSPTHIRIIKIVFKMAEGVGFEPTVGLNPRRCSRPFHSSALAPFRLAGYLDNVGEIDGDVVADVVGQFVLASRKFLNNSVSTAAHSVAITPCTTSG